MNIRAYFRLLLREARHVSKDSSLMLILLIAPILYGFMYGSIYINKGEDKIRLAVVDDDGSYLSRQLTQQLDSSPMIDIVMAGNLNDAQEKMYRGDTQGYFYIDKGLEKNVFSLKQANVSLAVNASRFLPSSDITAVVTKICLTVGAGARKIFFSKQGMSDAEAMAMTNPINLDYRPLFNESVTYGTFLLPGLLAIILQQTLMIGVAASLTSERENNTLRWVLKLAGNNLSRLIFGKGLFYLIVFMTFGLFFVSVNFNVLGVNVRGSYLSLAVLTWLFISVIIVLGMLIGSFFKTKLFAFQVLVFTSYPIFLITGYSMPYQSLPKLIRMCADILPTTPFLKAYISVVQAGGGISDNIPEIIHLIVLWLVFIILLLFRLQYLAGREKPLEQLKS
ncbi:ABC transporter permease [Daejeonia sp. YH14]|uniref:ABC transporter permease n=1 Tax=Daejeonia sp. YH14 TaxID=3439042 RepID=UPI003F49A9A0